MGMPCLRRSRARVSTRPTASRHVSVTSVSGGPRVYLVDVATGQLRWEIPVRDIHDLWVLPNGNMLVSGEKQIGINQGSEFVRFSGVVNPSSLTNNNVVLQEIQTTSLVSGLSPTLGQPQNFLQGRMMRLALLVNF